ncbi:MAG: hypothetical protein GX775_04900 [Erysipelothrix sp.]|nr:hypothetical protein [Erysipelothrix sp.]
MTENKNKTKKTKAKKVGTSRYSLLIIAVMVVLLAIPLYIVGDILYNAYIRQGVPIVGNRYDGDLDPAITNEQMNTLKSQLQAFEEIERVDINLQTSTLKIFLDVKPDVLHENYTPLMNKAYETVVAALPADVYFTPNGEVTMYDLELSVFNQNERVEGQEFIFFHLLKNATMETPLIQEVSAAKNQEVADRLRYEQALRDLGEDEAPVEETPAEETPTEETP